MAISELKPAPQTIFRQYVLTNIQYWRDYVAARTSASSPLERERDRVVKSILFAFELEEAWPFIAELIKSFSAYMERGGHWETWSGVLARAISTARRVSDSPSEVELSALMARLLKRQDRVREAIRQHQHTIRLARQTGDPYNEARACTNLGYLYTEQGRWYRAEVLCRHALRIFEQLDSDHGRAHTENHLGFLYTRQYHWELAQQHLERACSLWSSMKDEYGLMRGYINLGNLYVEAEQPEKALLYSEKALEQARLTGEASEIGVIYLNMSFAYRLTGDPLQAESYARQAETLYRRFSNSLYLPAAWSNLGEALLDQGRFEEARDYLEAALKYNREAKHKYGEIKTLMALIEYNLAIGDQLQAATELRHVETLIDQLETASQRHHFHSLLIKYHRSLSCHSEAKPKNPSILG
jgi:tetratricopeptide (TPR) repeat protein